MFWLLIIIGTILECAGDIFLKKNLLPYGILSHCLGVFFWAWSIRFETLSKSIVIFMVLNVILILLLSKYFLYEDISTQQWIGVVLCIAGITLI